MKLHESWRRLAFWSRRGSLEQELSDEIQAHVDLLARDFEHDGMTPAAALAAARQRIGNVTRLRETSRDYWGFPALEAVAQDLRYALRGLRRSSGFTVTVILTLGLGIGANAAMFGVIDQLMFRPFPYLKDPASVHRVYLQQASRRGVVTQSGFPYTRYLDLKRESRLLSQAAAFSEWQLALGSGDASSERKVMGVSASFFDFFNARPLLGRFFGAAEDSIPRGADVAVLGYGFWKTELGGKDVIGQTLLVGSLTTTIIGVAPEGFVGVSTGDAPAVFIPITTLAYGVNQGNPQLFFTRYNWDWMSMMVRRRPGVTQAAASADLSNAFVLSRIAGRAVSPWQAPDSVVRPRAIAGALKVAAGPDAGLESKTLLWVTGVAVVVLLIACANVTNLMFARVLRRRREIAVRLALGVSRRRLMMQFLTESLVLSGFGCVAGIAIAQWGGAALRLMVLRDGAAVGVVTDWRTLAVAAGVALASGVLIAVGPALLAIRGDLAGTLRSGSRAGMYQRSRTRSALLIVQGALSVVLLVGAGLFVRSLDNVRSMHMGWDAEPVLVAKPNFRGFVMDSSAQVTFRRRITETAQSIQGVEFTALVNASPFGTNTDYLGVAGIDSVARLGRFNVQWATPDYFKVVNTRIIRGRNFTADDREGGPLVAVVSESMARALWPGRDPIGQCMHVGSDTTPCTTVVGMAEDAVQGTLADEQHFLYYLPFDQKMPAGVNRILLRMSGRNASRFVEGVRRELQRAMPGQSYVTVSSLEDQVDDQRRSWRLGATMFVAFGVLALVVAAVGLYGIVSYNIAQRMHELGVRVALGARSGDVVGLVVGQGIFFAMSGVGIGLALALAAARWIQPLLFRESARDPLIYGAVGALLILVALLASAMPALRATRADPNSALRSE
jgi:putative ABC transport system permease protein